MSLRVIAFLCSGTMESVIAQDRPMPAVSWIKSFAPVLWISSMKTARSSNIFGFCQSHLPQKVSRSGAMPGIISPTLLFALSKNSLAASLSKWQPVSSNQPNSEVPPIGHMTIRFLISTFPIFQGVNNASYCCSNMLMMAPFRFDGIFRQIPLSMQKV